MAEHRLTDRLAFLFPPSRRLEGLFSLGLLFVLLLAAVVSLTDTFLGPDWGSLWPIALFGLLLGWILGIFRQPGFKALVVVIIIGFFYILLFLGGLSGQVGNVLVETFRLFSSLVSIEKFVPPDIRPLAMAWQDLLSMGGILLGQFEVWVSARMINPSAYDPLVIGMIWGVLIWFISAWAGWVVVVWKDALLAAFPAFMLCAGVLAYSRRVTITNYVALGATLFLLAVVQFERRKQIWDGSGVAYPRRKGRQITNAALMVTIGLVLFSAVLSSISIRRIREWLIEQRASTTQATVSIQSAPANGVTESTNKAPGQPARLPYYFKSTALRTRSDDSLGQELGDPYLWRAVATSLLAQRYL